MDDINDKVYEHVLQCLAWLKSEDCMDDLRTKVLTAYEVVLVAVVAEAIPWDLAFKEFGGFVMDLLRQRRRWE